MADCNSLNMKSTLPSDALVAMLAYVTNIPSGTLHAIMESYCNAKALEEATSVDINDFIIREDNNP